MNYLVHVVEMKQLSAFCYGSNCNETNFTQLQEILLKKDFLTFLK